MQLSNSIMDLKTYQAICMCPMTFLEVNVLLSYFRHIINLVVLKQPRPEKKRKHLKHFGLILFVCSDRQFYITLGANFYNYFWDLEFRNIIGAL